MILFLFKFCPIQILLDNCIWLIIRKKKINNSFQTAFTFTLNSAQNITSMFIQFITFYYKINLLPSWHKEGNRFKTNTKSIC